MVTYSLDRPPVARATANPTSGTVPLTVQIDASRSWDPDPGNTLSFSRDLNGDDVFDDSKAAAPKYHTYTKTGQRTYTVKLRVTDNYGAPATT
jgi:PKD repeat protein